MTVAPQSWAISVTALTGTTHPVTLLECCTDTTFTERSMHDLNDSMSKDPSGRERDILLRTPFSSWRWSQGTWLELCSQSVVTTTSPFLSPSPYAAVLRPWVQLDVKT